MQNDSFTPYSGSRVLITIFRCIDLLIHYDISDKQHILPRNLIIECNQNNFRALECSNVRRSLYTIYLDCACMRKRADSFFPIVRGRACWSSSPSCVVWQRRAGWWEQTGKNLCQAFIQINSGEVSSHYRDVIIVTALKHIKQDRSSLTESNVQQNLS